LLCNTWTSKRKKTLFSRPLSINGKASRISARWRAGCRRAESGKKRRPQATAKIAAVHRFTPRDTTARATTSYPSRSAPIPPTVVSAALTSCTPAGKVISSKALYRAVPAALYAPGSRPIPNRPTVASSVRSGRPAWT
jgi:hypothetical protein